ncbi:hypothetical protein pb186bvf_007660 [Paramecium bursaria]
MLRKIAQSISTFDKWNILKGDKVVLISGKDKGKMGTVARVYRRSNEVLVLGINKKFKRVGANQDGQSSGIQEVTRPVHVSKVSLIDPETGKASKIQRGFLEDGSPVRVTKKTGSVVPKPIDPAFKYAHRHKNKVDGVKDTAASDVVKITYQGEDLYQIREQFLQFIKEKEAKEKLLVFDK